MSKGYITELKDRAVVVVDGPEAAPFLQNLITSDTEALHEGAAGYGALLTPQGKILFDFLVIPDGGRFLLDVRRDLAADLVKRLALYRLRAKVTIAIDEALHVHAAWPGRPFIVDGLVVRDERHPKLGFRAIGRDVTGDGTYEAVPSERYHARRIKLGVPEGGIDFIYGDAFPHDANMDHLTGVSFAKGCYIGQEVVSRMEHRGTARRRVVQIDGDLPPTGTAIEADGKPVGTVGSVAGTAGLARVRVDRVRAANESGTPLLAAGVPIRVTLPDWAARSATGADDGEA